ncbi:hypothetical protein [Nostoc sp. DSM 114160]
MKGKLVSWILLFKPKTLKRKGESGEYVGNHCPLRLLLDEIGFTEDDATTVISVKQIHQNSACERVS